MSINRILSLLSRAISKIDDSIAHMLINEYALALSDYDGIADELTLVLEGRIHSDIELSPAARGTLLTLKNNHHLHLLGPIIDKLRQIKSLTAIVGNHKTSMQLEQKIKQIFGSSTEIQYIASAKTHMRYRNYILDVSEGALKQSLIQHLHDSKEIIDEMLEKCLIN